MATHLDDWIAETPESIAARLEAAREAQRQTRFTLGILAVISMMMVILAYNAYLSYDSKWILAHAQNVDGNIRKIDSADNADTVPDVLIVQALQDWAESRTATIDLLGIHVSVDDAPVLGTTSLFVVSLWLLLVARRENQTVGSLLRDTDTPGGDASSSLAGGSQVLETQPQPLYSNGQRWLIFHSIFANNLFATFDRWSRIDSLRNPNAIAQDDPIGIRRRLDRLSMSFARDFFFWFPVVASSLVFVLDRMSYFVEDPFAPNLTPQGYEAPWFFASAFVFAVCWVPLVICCRGAARYSRATTNVLREYGERLRADLLRRKSRQARHLGV
jgi:hypothetical protein